MNTKTKGADNRLVRQDGSQRRAQLNFGKGRV